MYAERTYFKYQWRKAAGFLVLMCLAGTCFSQLVDPAGSPLISKCCQAPVVFLDESGTTEITYASTNQAITLSSQLPGDPENCEATWFSKRACDQDFDDITDLSEQDNGIQRNHFPNHWGPVVYKSQFTCQGDRFDCTEEAVLPVVDWGLWFFNNEGRMKKFRREGSQPFDTDFYDPMKKTIIFIHGARQGSSANA
ncbi:MAG: hypothetical protein AAGA85_06410, partial [Bacteroidota bacterium]